jgi:murein DD-endopeptidase MepM/ murein hydrolase activator NlpD
MAGTTEQPTEPGVPPKGVPVDEDGSLTVDQVSEDPPEVDAAGAEKKLSRKERVARIRENAARASGSGLAAPDAGADVPPPPAFVLDVAATSPSDEDGSLTVEQVSEDPPDVAPCSGEARQLVLTGRVPDVIEEPPPPRRSGVLLDPVRAALDLPVVPVAHRPRRSLPPKFVALFGGLFGLATIASVIALAMELDHGPRPVVPAPSAKAPSALVAPVPTPTSSAAPVASAPTTPEPEEVPGPFRVAKMATDDDVRMVQGKLGQRSLMDALEEEHVPKPQIFRILKSFDDAKVFDKPKKSHSFVVALDRATKRVKGFEYQASATDVWQAREGDDGRLVGTKLDMKVEQRRVARAVMVKDDLKAAVVEAGFDDDLLDSLDDALEDRVSLGRFGKGTTLRIVAQEQTVYGKFARYLDIEAVEYATPKSDKPVRIYHFRGGKSSGYFDEHGKAPYKGGWRAPMKFPRVTSRFNPKRLHPVLHVVMPHNGVDFGAVLGTPVYAASHGTVEHVGPHGPSGNLVLLTHGGGIETGYAHLSRFAPGLKPGDKVETRQLVGFVGSTGRSTGPHLHFSVKKNGQFVDPLSTLKMDGERVLPKGDRDGFDAFKTEMDRVLDGVALPDRGKEVDPTPDTDEDRDNHEEDGETPAGSATPPSAPSPGTPSPAPADKPTPTKDESLDSAVWKPYLEAAHPLRGWRWSAIRPSSRIGPGVEPDRRDCERDRRRCCPG